MQVTIFMRVTVALWVNRNGHTPLTTRAISMNEGLTRLNHVGPHNPAVHESHLKYKGKRKPSASVSSGHQLLSFSLGLKPLHTHKHLAIQWTWTLTNVSFKLSSQKNLQGSENNTALLQSCTAPLDLWEVKPMFPLGITTSTIMSTGVHDMKKCQYQYLCLHRSTTDCHL